MVSFPETGELIMSQDGRVLMSQLRPWWLTLEALGSCLPEGKEDVTHDGGAAHSRLRDDSEDAVHILPQALL